MPSQFFGTAFLAWFCLIPPPNRVVDKLSIVSGLYSLAYICLGSDSAGHYFDTEAEDRYCKDTCHSVPITIDSPSGVTTLIAHCTPGLLN